MLEWAGFQHPLTQCEAPCAAHSLHRHNGYLDCTCQSVCLQIEMGLFSGRTIGNLGNPWQPNNFVMITNMKGFHHEAVEIVFCVNRMISHMHLSSQHSSIYAACSVAVFHSWRSVESYNPEPLHLLASKFETDLLKPCLLWFSMWRRASDLPEGCSILSFDMFALVAMTWSIWDLAAE